MFYKFVGDFVKQEVDNFLHKHADVAEIMLQKIQDSEKERKAIATWRQKEALKRTRLLRPDLLERPLTKEEIKLLKEIVEEESRL